MNDNKQMNIDDLDDKDIIIDDFSMILHEVERKETSDKD